MTVTFFSCTGMIPERKEEVTIFMVDKRGKEMNKVKLWSKLDTVYTLKFVLLYVEAGITHEAKKDSESHPNIAVDSSF